jgi:hypothetical protein
MNETINPITFTQLITGVDFSQSLILGLLTLSFALAFGMAYGFNAIYNKSRIKRFREYQGSLKRHFIFRLRELVLKPENFEEDFDKFVQEWEEYKSEVTELYNRLLKLRSSLLVIFLFSALSYFNRLLMPSFIFLGQKISFISNLLFFGGILLLIVFGWSFHKLEKNISKYELESPESGEELQRLINKLFKKGGKGK